MFLANRSRRGRDKFLFWKVVMFGAAGLLIYFGVRLEVGWVLWIAIILLIVGMALRFLPRRPREEHLKEQDDPAP